MDKVKVAVIGATGAVGQRFVQLLDNHPYFSLDVVAASDRSAGGNYGEVVRWCLDQNIPKNFVELKVEKIEKDIFKAEGIDIIFSALPAEVAKDTELELAEHGFYIFSNASAYRMARNVPLLIADINPEHVALIAEQQKVRPGYIVSNPNCSVVGLATALKPLADSFGIKSVIVTTYQALSGAGYPGVASLDIVGNVMPYIPGEEEKVESECNKILGKYSESDIELSPFDVLANCARVPVRDGHLEAVIVELDSNPTIDDVKNVFSKFNKLGDKNISLPTAPEFPINITDQDSRPQPILDLYAGTSGNTRTRGMVVTIGRVDLKNNKLRFYLLVHNTIRGAAGCSIMNAELAKVEGYL